MGKNGRHAHNQMCTSVKSGITCEKAGHDLGVSGLGASTMRRNSVCTSFCATWRMFETANTSRNLLCCLLHKVPSSGIRQSISHHRQQVSTGSLWRDQFPVAHSSRFSVAPRAQSSLPGSVIPQGNVTDWTATLTCACALPHHVFTTGECVNNRLAVCFGG